MSKLHYFQRYSQKENVVTNNTLLLLSRLYAHDPSYLEAFLNDLVETQEPIEVGPTFTQQVSSGGGIPDGSIDQASFKLVVETKTQTGAKLDQLKQHLKAFSGEETKVLILLTPTEQDEKFKDALREKVKEFNLKEENRGREVVEVCTTFDHVIRSFGGSLADHDHEMRALLEDYEDFCSCEGLLQRTRSRMRAVPCGKTFDDNVELEIYYQPVHRSSRQHDYLGIYKQKNVRHIGRVEKVVSADLVNGEVRGDKELAPEEKGRIQEAIHRAESLYGYRISTGHKFYLISGLSETSFEKVSPGGLPSQRYFDLVDELSLDNEKQLPDVPEIARLLASKSWR